ncbi:hypothetical protein ACHAWF_000677 [Thalassiosira exigua]
MTLKVHKIPYKMRPIVCCAGAFINCLSKWIDYWLQKLKLFVPTYIKDSTLLFDCLENISELSLNAKLFTSYAVLTYTNIGTNHAIKVIRKWLDKLGRHAKLP